MSAVKRLWGGAIECRLPEDFIDVSEIRQVPDNQEAFVDKNSNDSIVLELMETADLHTHYTDLAQANDAENISEYLVREDDICIARQHIAKKLCDEGPSHPRQEVIVALGRRRLQRADSDLLITYNSTEINDHHQIYVRLQSILESIQVLDWCLFLSGDE